MNKKNILKFVSIVGIVVFITLLIPPIVGFFYGEDVKKYLLIILLFLAINVGMFLYLKDHDIKLSIKESIISVNIVWLLIGVAGAMPYLIYTDIGFAGAFFESISGFTTTGATVFQNVEILPHSILFHRSLTHWIGGMGIIVLGVGLLPLLNPNGSLTLFKAESTGISLDKISPKIKDTAIKLWEVYFLITFADFVLLMIFGMNWFDAINHAFATISTGGFSTKNDSIGFFKSDAIIWVTTFFMFISSINFLSHIRFLQGDKHAYLNAEAKWFGLVVLFLSILLAIVHAVSGHIDFYTSLLHSSFSVVSVATSTGFATQDYEKWGNISIMLIFFAMLLGGNTGSTAGGVKTIRHVLFLKNIVFEIKKTLNPNTISSIFIDDKEIKSSTIRSIFGFLSLFFITIFITMGYLYARGYDEMTSLSTAISMVGNIGPAFGLTGPSGNYAFFSWYDKIVLSFSMIIGRLECYTVFIVFSNFFWKKF
ncbi:TrkH family potassium uptake protein [Sulfurimonas sp. HSL-1716]|uniref:TrkH family potassium uptake protein n=1 Tax=Hydrocurvibacter sulfurireducens TaxID=3131937 RepID=UPI0031F7A3B9